MNGAALLEYIESRRELIPTPIPGPELKPWLQEEQMELAKRVIANEWARHRPSIPDWTGRRFARLVVLRTAPNPYRPGRIYVYECRCDCGKLTTVNSWRLLHGVTRSCGCLQRELAGRRISANQAKGVEAARRRKLARKAAA